MRRAIVSFVFAGALAGCGEKSYVVTFTCDPGGVNCPVGETCPIAPPGSGCEDVPGLFGHPATPVQFSRPPGCRVSLSYENPAYPGMPQTCICETSTDWLCPL